MPFIALYFTADLVIVCPRTECHLDQPNMQEDSQLSPLCFNSKIRPSSHSNKDVCGLAAILVLHVMEKATQTQNHIASLLKDPSIDRKGSNSLMSAWTYTTRSLWTSEWDPRRVVGQGLRLSSRLNGCCPN